MDLDFSKEEAVPVPAFRTKSGEPITLRFFRDIEGDNNRGWQVDAVVAFVDGMEAGSHKISFIPAGRFDARYPDVMWFLCRMKNWHVMSDWRGEPYGETTQIVNLTRRNPRLTNLSRHVTEEDIAALSPNKRAAILRRARRVAMAEYGHLYQFAKDFFRDAPLVDYIKALRITHQGQPFEYRDRTLMSDQEEKTTRDFSGQGVGYALYIAAALWMQHRGMRLRASGLQTEEARACWDRFASDGLVVEEPMLYESGETKTVRYLVIPERHPLGKAQASEPATA